MIAERSRLLAGWLVVSLLALCATDLCHGWSSNAQERAACCARMENACDRIASADCCAESEQRRQRTTPPATPQPAADTTLCGRVTPVVQRVATNAADSSSAARPETHLLNAVFLI